MTAILVLVAATQHEPVSNFVWFIAALGAALIPLGYYEEWRPGRRTPAVLVWALSVALLLWAVTRSPDWLLVAIGVAWLIALAVLARVDRIAFQSPFKTLLTKKQIAANVAREAERTEARAAAQTAKRELSVLYRSRGKPAFDKAMEVVQWVNEQLDTMKQPYPLLSLLSKSWNLRDAERSAQMLDQVFGDPPDLMADEIGDPLRDQLVEYLTDNRDASGYQTAFANYYQDYRVLIFYMHLAAGALVGEVLADQLLKDFGPYKTWKQLHKEFISRLRDDIAKPERGTLRESVEKMGFGIEDRL